VNDELCLTDENTDVTAILFVIVLLHAMTAPSGFIEVSRQASEGRELLLATYCEPLFKTSSWIKEKTPVLMSL